MNEDEIKSAIKKEEGLRLDVYPDITGQMTIGYGHLLSKGSKIPLEAAEIIFEADYQNAVKDYEKLHLDLDPVRRAAIVDMLFNMGLTRVQKFQRMIAALREGNWDRAAIELMDSGYARQLPNRAKRNRDRILYGTGQWYDTPQTAYQSITTSAAVGNIDNGY